VSSGEHVALVGESGVGKTTLMSLLTRLYSSYQGGIYLNGKEIRTLPLEELRRKVGVVSQEPELINGTIWENICYGCEGATREDARRIAILLGLDAMVLECKEGYDTILDSKAPPFSQGQLQMLSLSRMVLRGPEVLILDESTSSIDTETESLLQKAIYQAMEGRTCLFIAHRLTSIKQMNRICVMEKGVITEEGTHEELLKRGGSYAAAYALRRQGEASLT
ncbi:MAG: ATP-binding cassette domain-containing protein, partial [Blautia sp.]|nr:ATP-binding cassette domain-containing protein [Blautia sp.]